MSTRKYHLEEQEIPEGFQIFEERLEVAGVSFRKEDAAAFATAKDGWLEFERELGNKHDSNAIRVIGCNNGLFGTKRRFIGYVPREVSRPVVEGGYWGSRLCRNSISGTRAKGKEVRISTNWHSSGESLHRFR